MNDLNDLHYFVAVVRHQGFSAAARATGIEKTRLSRRIAALEAQVGVRLLERSTRRLALSEAGQRFFEHAVEVVDGARHAYDAVAELSREPAGWVRMSSSVALAQSYLTPVLAGFLQRYPKVRVQLEATDRESDLPAEQIDLALRARTSLEATPGLVARDLGQARRILVASPAYLAAAGAPTTVDDLQRATIIGACRNPASDRLRWSLHHAALPAVTLELRPALLVSDLRVQLDAACQGVGIALLPEPVVRPALADGRLQPVLPAWSAAEMHIYLVYPAPRGMRPAVRCLIDYLLAVLPGSAAPAS